MVDEQQNGELGEVISEAVGDMVPTEDSPVEAPGSDDDFEFDLPEHWSDKDKDEFKAIRDAKAALAFT